MLEAAARIIAERGLCDARIADVAGRAGLSPGLVVYYFGSKEKLLTEALTYAEDLFYIRAFQELAVIPGARERLVRLIELACPPDTEGSAQTEGDWTLWVELWSRALRDEGAARKREALDRRWRNTIADIVRQGQRDGEFGPQDAGRFATHLAALMDGLVLQVLLHDSEVTSGRMRALCLETAAQHLGFDLAEARAQEGEERRRPRAAAEGG